MVPRRSGARYEPDLLGGVGTLEVPAWTAGSQGLGRSALSEHGTGAQPDDGSRHSVSALGASRRGQHGGLAAVHEPLTIPADNRARLRRGFVATLSGHAPKQLVRLTQAQLDEVVRLHALFLVSRGGRRAVLVGYDLSGLDLIGGDMSNADCTGSSFFGANLCGSKLRQRHPVRLRLPAGEHGRMSA